MVYGAGACVRTSFGGSRTPSSSERLAILRAYMLTTSLRQVTLSLSLSLSLCLSLSQAVAGDNTTPADSCGDFAVGGYGGVSLLRRQEQAEQRPVLTPQARHTLEELPLSLSVCVCVCVSV